MPVLLHLLLHSLAFSALISVFSCSTALIAFCRCCAERLLDVRGHGQARRLWHRAHSDQHLRACQNRPAPLRLTLGVFLAVIAHVPEPSLACLRKSRRASETMAGLDDVGADSSAHQRLGNDRPPVWYHAKVLPARCVSPTDDITLLIALLFGSARHLPSVPPSPPSCSDRHTILPVAGDLRGPPLRQQK